MTRELLLPCPFCGGEASFGTVKYSDVTVNEQGWQQDTFHSVNCVVCGTSNRGIVGYVTQDKAREKWNRRAQAEASAARLPQDGGTVPREPTQEMIDAVYGKFNILGALPQLWRAMWDAAPRASEAKPEPAVADEMLECSLCGKWGAHYCPTAVQPDQRVTPTPGAAPDAELIVEINHYFEDGGEADPCAHPCENLLQRCRDRLEQGANATSIAWKFGYAQAQEEKQPPITDAEVAACLEPLPDWNTEVGTLLERAVQMRGTVSALWDSLGIAKKQIQMYHAEIARKDKALREIASIRPFGMISDAQIIASAALGDTQEPT